MTQTADPHRLDGSTVLVTGASSGIGRETAVVLSSLGARLVLVARDRDRLEKTREALVGDGHLVECLDLATADDLTDWMADIAKRAGKLAGLVHCAGVQSLVPLRSVTAQRWSNDLRLNVTAGVLLTQAFRQRTVVAAPASVVLMASVMGIVGQPGLSSYCASKSALTGLARSLALELAAEQIRVNCVAAGVVGTPMADALAHRIGENQMKAVIAKHPLGQGQPTDVAYAVSFLLSPAARWITGTTLVVDGGYTAH